MPKTKQQVLREVTENYLKTVDPKNPPAMDDLVWNLINSTWQQYSVQNLNFAEKERKWKYPDHLAPVQIADIILHLRHVALIRFAPHAAGDRDTDMLAVYQTEGKDAGIYAADEYTFKKIARNLYYNIPDRDFKEVLEALREKAPIINFYEDRYRKKNLIAVGNGIFDYDTKQLLPFTPDEVFLSKCPVDYVPGAVNPVIRHPIDGTVWDVETWMKDLSDNVGVSELLWQIIGAAIRPNVSWNKAAWFYSESGNNGKGTLCSLMRNICGECYTSLPISEMGKDFMLESIVGKSAIITDENDVGVYIDKAANLKALITGDAIMINRKFKQPITYRFHGLMVQCLNELPKIRDRSDSLYRRQLFVPFEKCFTGMERKYIKDDYLKRTEVLEYVLKRVLEMNYYDLDEPEACKATLDRYEVYNDPIRQFWNEVEGEIKWDLLPNQFLYDLYSAWSKKNNPAGLPYNKNAFLAALKNILKDDSVWKYSDAPVTTGSKMDKSEPLILEYGLSEWMNSDYHGIDENKKAKPAPSRIKSSYRGVVRMTTAPTAPLPDDLAEKAEIIVEKRGE